MPQMAPMNWLILFLYFLITFMFLYSIIYFTFLKNKEMKMNNNKMNKINYYNKFI